MVRRVRKQKPQPPYDISNEVRKQWWKELSGIVGFTVPLDGLITTVSNKLQIDILKLDDIMGSRIKEYYPDKAMYKGKNKSMREVVELVYGERAVTLIELLIS